MKVSLPMFDVDSVRRIARAQLAGDDEAGAALCVYVDGHEVICDSFGMADARRGIAYGVDSLQITMSIAKGVTTVLLAMLIDRGQIDPGQRVAHYWPEFAAAGKGDISVAQLFSHQAGLPLLDGGLSLALVADRERLAQALAAQAPLWAPGTQHGYHAVTFGHYADALFERVSGHTLCELLAGLRERLGIEIYCGLPRELGERAVQVLREIAPPAPAFVPERDSLTFRVLTNFPEMLVEPQAFFNGEALRSVCIPATNMYANARSLAKLYSALLEDGDHRLCSPQALATVTRERVRGADAVNLGEMAYGLGFQRPSALTPFSPNRAAFGHCGIGGSVAFADPDRRLALAWMPSRIGSTSCDARLLAVVDAVYAAL